MGDLSPHFNASEFRCPCGKCTGGQMSMRFVERLERLRELFGKPLTINSGFRCPAHNKAEGGEPKSMHLLGRAADIRVESDADRFQLLRLAVGLGFGGIGILKHAIHLDDRDRQACWTYYP